jgi:hypothetical protein
LYNLQFVPKPHPDFTSYQVIAGEKTGICQIIANAVFSPLNDSEAFLAKITFNRVRQQLIVKYGTPKDQLAAEIPPIPEAENELNEWVRKWNSQRAHQSSTWPAAGTEPLTNEIQDISLGFTDVFTGLMITIQYKLINFEECSKEVKELENKAKKEALDSL